MFSYDIRPSWQRCENRVYEAQRTGTYLASSAIFAVFAWPARKLKVAPSTCDNATVVEEIMLEGIIVAVEIILLVRGTHCRLSPCLDSSVEPRTVVILHNKNVAVLVSLLVAFLISVGATITAMVYASNALSYDSRCLVTSATDLMLAVWYAYSLSG